MTLQPRVEQPKIAVLLPVHNGAKYLRQSVQSVLQQSLTDFELVICDDASTDSCPEILASFSDPRIRLFRHSANRGLFSTLNELVRASSAPLIHLWAQDDIMLPECLQRHVDFHAEHPDIVMSYSGAHMIDENDRIVVPAGNDPTPAVISPLLAAQIMFYYGSICANIANVAVTRQALIDFGMFREDLKVSGDFDMWVRLTRSHPIGRVHRTLVHIRQHSEQFSRRHPSELAFIRENRTIIDELLQRLPHGQQSAGKRYLIRQHHRSYAHAAVRCLLRGDMTLASSILNELRSRDSLGRALFFWLVTGNGRWWPRTPPPRVTDMTR